MTLFYIFIIFIIIQRIFELNLASKNKKKTIQLGAEEYDSIGFKYIALMHILFIISLIVENEFQGHKNQYSLELVFIFLFAQILRYWAIITLGIFWNTRIIVLKNSELIKKGPYKYIKHPNYLAVVLEFLTIPLIFSLYITSITFSLLNLIVLWRRVRIEESVLGLK